MTLDDIAAELHEVVRDLEPGCVAGPDALRLVRVASEITKLGSTATALYAQRCVETGVWAKDRASRVPAVTPAEWLADIADAPIHTARDALAVAAALPDCPAAEEALRAGTLSLPVAREVTAAAAAGGASAERRVLKTATREGLRGAKVEAQRVLATASDARERAERVHRERRRHRWITRDGKWNLHLEGPIALGAEIEACLAPFDDAAWDAAAPQSTSKRDTPDAIAFDGMLAMARAARDGCGRPTSNKPRGRAKTRDHVVAHIDATALVAGDVEPGERCEIPGVGPVAVEHVRRMLGDSVLTILVEDGQDVRTFNRPGRKVVAQLAQLVAARDATCIITGCGRSARLEGDHGEAVSDGGDSDAANLRGLCHQHHRMKSRGWKLAHHPDGTCTLEPPDDGSHPPGGRPRDAGRSATRPDDSRTASPAGRRRAAAA